MYPIVISNKLRQLFVQNGHSHSTPFPHEENNSSKESGAYMDCLRLHGETHKKIMFTQVEIEKHIMWEWKWHCLVSFSKSI